MQCTALVVFVDICLLLLLNSRRSVLLRDLPPALPTSASVSHYEPIEFFGMRENELAPGVQKEESEQEKGGRRSVSPQGWLEITEEHLAGANAESG